MSPAYSTSAVCAYCSASIRLASAYAEGARESTYAVALKTIGAGLMTAMLITAAAAAYLLARRLSHRIGIAALMGAGSGMVGLYLS